MELALSREVFIEDTTLKMSPTQLKDGNSVLDERTGMLAGSVRDAVVGPEGTRGWQELYDVENYGVYKL